MLKYGIILNAAKVKQWQLRCIERLHQSKLAELRCVVNDISDADAHAVAARLYCTVPAENYTDESEIFALLPEVARFNVDLQHDARSLALQRFDLDFLIAFHDERVCLPLANAARFGVWYFAHGDLAQFRSAVPGFWEVLNDRDVTAAFLLQARDDGSAGVPLKSGFLPTVRHSFERNAQAVLDAITWWPQHVCWDITHGAAAYFGGTPLAQPPLSYGVPSHAETAAMHLREQRHRTAAFFRENFCAIEWTVARVRKPAADFIGNEQHANVELLYRASTSRYFADPCVVLRDSRAYVFVEEYRRMRHTGSVAVSELGDRGAGAPQAAIEEPHHLSYPHVFEYGGETYCIPESGRIRKVCLYRCVEFPHKWEFVHTLIDGFEAADSTIVRHGDRWWLFCTSSEAVARGHYSHLYIWHAQDLFGNWTQHVRNPVKIDARSARPAGAFFMHDGTLYRPAQDCSRSYGGAVRINRIDTLTQTEFEETVVGTIRPPRHGYSRGLHTLAAAGDCCIVDVERYAFSFLSARYTCTQAIKHALLRAGVSQAALAWIERRVRARETP